jgi:hypothetical protein
MALVVLSVLTISFVMNVAKASSISVGTYDASGLAKDAFASLEPVRIIAESTNKPLTIKIYDPDNLEIFSETKDVYIYDNTLEGITTKSGIYTVEASSPMSSTRKNFATVFFNVIPEVQFGTASIAIVSLGALGVYRLAKRKKITSS